MRNEDVSTLYIYVQKVLDYCLDESSWQEINSYEVSVLMLVFCPSGVQAGELRR